MVGDKREQYTTESESGSDFDFPRTLDEDPVVEALVKGLTKRKKIVIENLNTNRDADDLTV